MATPQYEALIAAGERSLGPDEYWCIVHPGGVLDATASKRFDQPIIMVCDALEADWDDLTEQGYRLGRCDGAGNLI